MRNVSGQILLEEDSSKHNALSHQIGDGWGSMKAYQPPIDPIQSHNALIKEISFRGDGLDGTKGNISSNSRDWIPDSTFKESFSSFSIGGEALISHCRAADVSDDAKIHQRHGRGIYYPERMNVKGGISVGQLKIVPVSLLPPTKTSDLISSSGSALSDAKVNTSKKPITYITEDN
jgi:hypothetical protein